jgi:prevent-host-death family protein
MEAGIYEGKTHFAKLIERAERGETTTITRRGKPVAVIAPAPKADKTALLEAMAKLDALRRSRPAGRKPITVAEIIAAKKEGQR